MKSRSWDEVIGYAKSHACQWSRQPTEGEWGIHHLDTPPHNRLLGPVFERGETCGLVAVGSEILCRWGDIHRADMTFSVTKSYLAMVMGVAWDQGLIKDLDQPVGECLLDYGISNEGFDRAHNQQVSWRQLLQFTSEWQGECFGVPDQVDHYRVVGVDCHSHSRQKGQPRPLQTPGSYWEYNDVRINQFALALMKIFGRPLPEVFDEFIMQPIGASNQWCWHGYENSWIELDDGNRLQSVPGGGHWGGGVVISAHDQLFIAQLMLEQGHCKGKQVLSKDWVSQMCTPASIAPWYGFFTWLNTDHAMSKIASEDSYFALGIGGQLVWHEPKLNLVVVLRWIDVEHQEEIMGLILEKVVSELSAVEV